MRIYKLRIRLLSVGEGEDLELLPVLAVLLGRFLWLTAWIDLNGGMKTQKIVTLIF
jgi:hypothetical protein